ncbi:MAG: domain containing protein [Verrucomicrobiales bacterium]|nr:domain containing protein [Verrucomicrobiales bacterium]
MNWYYVKEGQQVGPISQGELAELFASGAITGETLIWRDGLPQWQSYNQVLGAGAANAGGVPPLSTAPGMVRCAECGRLFPKAEVMDFNGKLICATCKPVFLQRLREGAAAPGSLEYAGFWRRLLAKIVDGLVMYAVNFGITAVLGISSAMAPTRSTLALGAIAASLSIGLVVPLIYNTVMLARFGATLGKMACGLQVVTPEGGPISYGRALGRTMSEWISSLICSIGYIMAAFDDEKRALHDRIASTRVIIKPR